MTALLAIACGSSPEQHLEDARALQQSGQLAESIEPLRAFLATDPAEPEANLRLGLALLQTGQPTPAVFPLQQARRDPAFATEAGVALAATQIQLEAFEDAVRTASEVLDAEPERADVRALRAQANLGMNAYAAALPDTAWLRERNPDDYTAVLRHATALAGAGRFDEADAAFARAAELAAQSGDVQTAAAGCLAVANYFETMRRDDDAADNRFRACLERYPTDALGLDLYSKFLRRLDRTEDLIALWERAAREAPDDLSLQFGLATRRREAGDADATAALEQAVRRIDTAAAWQALANYHRSAQRPDEALAALEQVIAIEGDEREDLAFAKADLLVDAGRLEEARAAAANVDHESFQHMIEGRLQLAEGRPREALAAFEAGARLWPNNAGARYWAGEAALQLGDEERAQTEFRESFRINQMATNAGARLARLHLDRGELREALDLGRTQALNEAPNAWDAALVWSRAAIALGDWTSARAALGYLERVGTDPAAALAQRIALARAEGGTGAARSELAGAELALDDPANEVALRAVIATDLAAGDGERALARVDAALARGAEVASLHELRGRVLFALGRADAARAAFERTLELDPREARAKQGLSSLAFRNGDIDAALALLDEAIALDPAEPDFAEAAAQMLMTAGRREEGLARLRQVVERHPGSAAAANDLAWALAEESRELDFALSLAQRAVRLRASPETLDTLGWVQLRRGDARGAVRSFERALELEPSAGAASIHYRLGLALAAAGESARARESLEQALGGGPFPESREAEQKLAELRQP